MPKKLNDLISKAQKDRDLFMDLLINMDGTLTKRSIQLDAKEKAALAQTVHSIRESITVEMAKLKLIVDPVGPLADGIIGW